MRAEPALLTLAMVVLRSAAPPIALTPQAMFDPTDQQCTGGAEVWRISPSSWRPRGTPPLYPPEPQSQVTSAHTQSQVTSAHTQTHRLVAMRVFEFPGGALSVDAKMKVRFARTLRQCTGGQRTVFAAAGVDVRPGRVGRQPVHVVGLPLHQHLRGERKTPR